MSDTLTNYENVTSSAQCGDDITASASPRPWRSEPSGRVGTNCLFDANGAYVATVANIDATLIVEAVNNYDKKKSNAKSEKRNPDTEDEFDPAALKSYPRPWSVSIDDENCRAVIRDADGLEVAYIHDVVRSRAGETAQMFVGLVEERDRLRDIVRRMLPFVEWTDAFRPRHPQCERRTDLASEARAAIGEDRP